MLKQFANKLGKLMKPNETMNHTSQLNLTKEQKHFIKVASSGKNVLVDACIGSGKTTAIQYLCNEIPQNKHILYLTYNRLLKLDAIEKITNKNVHVQNYHGYAAEQLCKKGISVSQDELLREFNRRKIILPQIDILIVDEYQDIDSMSAQMLGYIKKSYPNVQIIMVGDMQQKIYDYTTLDVLNFVKSFLDEYVVLQFTTCFRLSKDWAEQLGKVWGKTIHGVNENCRICHMTINEAADFLKTQEPGDILCLGPRQSHNNIGILLNKLEKLNPEKFNKNTTYASIRDEDINIQPRNNCAIFTTYDSSKGLEKKICVIIDWTESYWAMRSKTARSYKILRNIFCVAASRGKDMIIVIDHGEPELSFKTLKTKYALPEACNKPFMPSEMFDFAKQEYIDACYSCLKIRQLNNKRARTTIEIQRTDGLIDLSPCIGIYQEAMYFENYDIDAVIDQYCKTKCISRRISTNASLMRKILYLTSLETNQDRYDTQINADKLMTAQQWEQISARLQEQLNKTENTQILCNITCEGVGNISGFADVVRDDTVYELKFTSSLSRAHYLQCAVYMIGLDKPKGILWNIRTNEMCEIEILNKKYFLNTLVTLMSDGKCRTYKGPHWPVIDFMPQNNRATELEKGFNQQNYGLSDYNPEKHDKSAKYWLELRQAQIKKAHGLAPDTNDETIAIIDTETTWNNVHLLKFGVKFFDVVFSVGVVIADKETLSIKKCVYYILTPECEEKGMYDSELYVAPKDVTKQCTRQECINEINSMFQSYNTHDIFAYNAAFDRKHLPELSNYTWRDIITKAAYLESNPRLSESGDEFHASGRLKRGFGVETMFQLMTKDPYFIETHNALFDAMDELVIMQQLGCAPESYKPLVSQSKKICHRDELKAKRIGEARIMNCGLRAEIIEYNNRKDITVKFNNGRTRKCSYDAFKQGKVANPDEQRKKGKEPYPKEFYIGKSQIMNCGLRAEIIDYVTRDDITIKFEDGTIQKCKYARFAAGNVANANFFAHKRIGESRNMHCGLMATIISYTNSDNITIKFEDGAIRNCRYDKFKEGKVAHPTKKTFRNETS